jgi:hypothetical protein
VTRIYLPWSQEELDFLKVNYGVAPVKEICRKLQGRNWKSICKKASVIRVRHPGFGAKKSDLSVLLKNDPVSYYWIGFLLADGSFSDRRIHVGVAKKDLQHLKAFMKFVGSTNKIQKLKNSDHCRVKMTCVSVVSLLKKKFDISSRKTYEPCSLGFVKDKDLLFSLIVGYIDGDGSVSKNGKYNSFRLHVVGHASWVDNFTYMKDFIYEYFSDNSRHTQAKVVKHRTCVPQDRTRTKRVYLMSYFQISKKELLVAIKNRAAELGLPVLKRKLGKIKA